MNVARELHCLVVVFSGWPYIPVNLDVAFVEVCEFIGVEPVPPVAWLLFHGLPHPSQNGGGRLPRSRSRLSGGSMMSIPRVAALATNTVRQAVRSRLLYTLLFFGLVLIATSVGVSSLSYVESE